MVRDGYPNTFISLAKSTGIRHPETFDPALKQFPAGFRNGDPEFENLEIQLQWSKARNQVLDHLAWVIGNSKWKDYLVVRGSYVLSKWYPDFARQPGDIDWVTHPHEMTLDEIEAMFQSILELLRDDRPPQGIELHCDQAATDEIWSYDRFPGKRLAIPWTVDFLPKSTSPQFVAQMDFVLGEPIHSPIETLSIATDKGTVPLRTASKEQSLEWKIQWLSSDAYPQAKDLYDAWCLARDVDLPYQALVRALTAGKTMSVFKSSNWHEFCGTPDCPNIQELDGFTEEDVKKMLFDLYQSLGPIMEETRVWLKSQNRSNGTRTDQLSGPSGTHVSNRTETIFSKAQAPAVLDAETASAAVPAWLWMGVLISVLLAIAIAFYLLNAGGANHPR